MVVNPSVPAKTVPEFIAYAKANPGKINIASTGIGNRSMSAGELFKMMAGVDMVHVPYRGAAPALNDLIGGQVQVMFACIAFVDRAHQGWQAARAGGDDRRRAGTRCPMSRQSAISCRATRRVVWFGLGAPKGNTAEFVEKLNGERQCGPSPTPN